MSRDSCDNCGYIVRHKGGRSLGGEDGIGNSSGDEREDERLRNCEGSRRWPPRPRNCETQATFVPCLRVISFGAGM